VAARKGRSPRPSSTPLDTPLPVAESAVDMDRIRASPVLLDCPGAWDRTSDGARPHVPPFLVDAMIRQTLNRKQLEGCYWVIISDVEAEAPEAVDLWWQRKRKRLKIYPFCFQSFSK
jgi:hypothetical protein